MAIKPNCERCKKELDEFGAILLGPPNSFDSVEKFHICKGCYNELISEIKSDMRKKK